MQFWACRLDGYRGDPLERAQAFCRNVIQQETVQLGRGGQCGSDGAVRTTGYRPPEEWREVFVDHPQEGDHAEGALVEVALTLRGPLAAVGAPTATYFPEVASRLHTCLCIPSRAETANAV